MLSHNAQNSGIHMNDLSGVQQLVSKTVWICCLLGSQSFWQLLNIGLRCKTSINTQYWFVCFTPVMLPCCLLLEIIFEIQYPFPCDHLTHCNCKSMLQTWVCTNMTVHYLIIKLILYFYIFCEMGSMSKSNWYQKPWCGMECTYILSLGRIASLSLLKFQGWAVLLHFRHKEGCIMPNNMV